MIIAIVITSITAVTLVSMFWQPWMADDWVPEPPYKPTKREKYIKRIDQLIKQGQYDEVKSLLRKPKYPLENLPVAYWKSKLTAERARIEKEAANLDALKSLEEILG